MQLTLLYISTITLLLLDSPFMHKQMCVEQLLSLSLLLKADSII